MNRVKRTYHDNKQMILQNSDIPVARIIKIFLIWPIASKVTETTPFYSEKVCILKAGFSLQTGKNVNILYFSDSILKLSLSNEYCSRN